MSVCGITFCFSSPEEIECKQTFLGALTLHVSFISAVVISCSCDSPNTVSILMDPFPGAGHLHRHLPVSRDLRNCGKKFCQNLQCHESAEQVHVAVSRAQARESIQERATRGGASSSLLI